MENSKNNTTFLQIGHTDVFLENQGEGRGQITVNDRERGTYQSYWGSMGSSIEDFMLRINEHYFTSNLLRPGNGRVFDAKGTFASVRKFIREELGLPWYEHLEFQKDLREKLKNFQDNCEEINSDRYFVDSFGFYIGTMPDFYLIGDRYERGRVEKDFNNISEPWHFIATKPSKESLWLQSLHTKIKKRILKMNQNK